MSRGRPDYNMPEYANAGGNETPDQSFVALNGLTPLTSLGRVYVADFFDSLLSSWEAINTGAGIAPVIKHLVQQGINRPFVCQLDPGGTSGISLVQKTMSTNSDTKQGFEWFFTPAANHGNIELVVQHNKANQTAYTFQISYNRVSGIWKYGTAAAGTTIYTPPIAQVYQGASMRVKIITDMNTGYFDKLFIGEMAIDLQAYPANIILTSTAIGRTKATFAVVGDNGAIIEPVYLSGIIWTTEEP